MIYVNYLTYHSWAKKHYSDYTIGRVQLLEATGLWTTERDEKLPRVTGEAKRVSLH